MIREILTFRSRRRATDLDLALEYLGRVVRRRAVVFVLSDFLDEGFGERLRIAAKRHDVTAVRVADRREAELPAVGLIELEDAETGEIVIVDTSDLATTTDFRDLSARERGERSALFREAGVGEIDIWTDEAYVDAIVRYFRAREKRRGRWS